MSVTILSNVYTPTLGAGITNVSTSLTLSADSGDNGHVWMIIDGEGLDGDKSGTSVTNLSRASFKVNGVQSAASHSTGATIYFVSAFEGMKACFPTKIAEQSGAAANYTFSSIPATYSTLYVKYVCRDGSATNGQDFVQVQLNGDAGANYIGQRLTSNGVTTTSADQTATTQGNIGICMGGASGANAFAVGEIHIPFYNTAVARLLMGRCSSQNGVGANLRYIDTFTVLWNSTAAVTSIKLFPSTGSFVANSAATLYGEP